MFRLRELQVLTEGARKPVGLVYVCVYYKGRYEVKRIHSSRARETVRERAAVTALDLVRRCVERYGDTSLK